MKWQKSTHCGASNTCAEVATWVKASHCSNEANCVETASVPEQGFAIRDSKFPDMPYIELSDTQFARLLNDLKQL